MTECNIGEPALETFQVYVTSSNISHVIVDAASAEEAEKMVSQWVEQGDSRFYLNFSTDTDGDLFDPDSAEADPI